MKRLITAINWNWARGIRQWQVESSLPKKAEVNGLGFVTRELPETLSHDSELEGRLY
jgi:hypothetical protein